MAVIKYRGVFIDFCEDSDSVWLDPEELEKILESEKLKQEPKKSVGDHIADGLDAGVTVTLDAIIEAILSSW